MDVEILIWCFNDYHNLTIYKIITLSTDQERWPINASYANSGSYNDDLSSTKPLSEPVLSYCEFDP